MKNRVISGVVWFFTFFILGLVTRCYSQSCGDVQKIVYKGDTVNVQCDKMVLMDVETFADYWHSNKQLEELRNEVPEWTSIVDSIRGQHEKNRVELDSIIDLKSEQIEFYKENQEELLRNLYYCDKHNKRLFRKERRNALISRASIGINAVLLLILL